MKLRTLLFLLPLAAASCSDAFDDVSQPAGTINVTVGSDPGIGIRSRTALEPDGEAVRWIEGDQIALWAVDATGSTTLSAHPFRMYHYNATFNTAKFTADIPAMPEGKYDYYAVSPQPLVATGQIVAFEIPSEQQVTPVAVGKPTKIPCDVMIAEPVLGADALTSGDNSDKINFVFKHKTHVLKIRIPENKMGMPISALELTFPQPVTGMLTFDAFDLSIAPQLTNPKNTVRLNFTEPMDAGMVVCASIIPVELTSADEIIIKAYTATKESVPAKMSGKAFAEAHTTPIALTIPEIYRVTVIDFSLDGDGTQTLGEKVNSITLTAPAGTDLFEGTNTRTFAVNDTNQYSLSYEGEFIDNLSGKELTVSYDSDNAIVSNKFTVPQLTGDERNTMTGFKVPYLFEEDFSGMTKNFSGSAATGNAAGSELSGSGLPGWYAGARSQGYADSKSVNIQHYNNFGGPYESRIDSSPLSNIKEGKNVTIKVVFNADWKKNKSGWMNLLVGGATAHNLNDAISNQQTIGLTNNSGASNWNIPSVRTTTIPNFTSNQSIAFKTNGENKGVFNYENLYLDNIKVQIAN